MKSCSNIEYLVYEDKGTVICKIWECEDVALKRINKYAIIAYDEEDKYAINEVYIGISRSNPNKKFDIDRAKKEAFEKAKAKRKRAINNAIKKYIKDTEIKLARLEMEGIAYD